MPPRGEGCRSSRSFQCFHPFFHRLPDDELQADREREWRACEQRHQYAWYGTEAYGLYGASGGCDASGEDLDSGKTAVLASCEMLAMLVGDKN